MLSFMFLIPPWITRSTSSNERLSFRLFASHYTKIDAFSRTCKSMPVEPDLEWKLNFFVKFLPKNLSIQKKCVPLQRFQRERALSSAGSEHLPYKQRVGGSNPSAPTTNHYHLISGFHFSWSPFFLYCNISVLTIGLFLTIELKC